MGLLESCTSNTVASQSDFIEIESEDDLIAMHNPQATDCTHCQKCQENNIDFTSIILDRLEMLINSAPYHSLQWLASVCYANKPIQEWLLNNMNIWVKPLLISHKQTNIRFSAAILLANLVPNRNFRETFTSSRNMLVPYKTPNSNNSLLNLTSNSTSNSSLLSGYNQPELNYDFDSEECKKTLHTIIKYLFSIVEDLGQYVGVNQAAKTAEAKGGR